MILIGRYLSPFVRRVAATMHHYGFEYEHRPIKAGGVEQDEIRRSNPLGRVPTLILDDGMVLSDSALILDYLDAQVGAQRSLTPLAGDQRFVHLALLSIATGAAEKSIAAYSERLRPEDKQHQPVFDGAVRQARDGLTYLEGRTAGTWIAGKSLSQVDVSVAAYWSFMQTATPEILEGLPCPKLAAIVAQTLELPAFKATAFEG